MARRAWNCPGCLLIAVLGVLLAGALSLGRGDAHAARLRTQAEQDAAVLLAQAGYPWARLTIDDAVAYVQGQAPDPVSRLAALRAAREVLRPMMGVPGVFARLEDGMSEARGTPPAAKSAGASPEAATGPPGRSAAPPLGGPADSLR